MPGKKTYADKRDFEATPEPAASFDGNVDLARATPGSYFMIHQHYATHLHYDLRLEFFNGPEQVLVSFAIPRNLPLKKGEPHLAVHVEDHPWDYRTFSGTIPQGNYGAGEVRIFDEGTFEVTEQGKGKLSVRLDGRRLKGLWHLNRTNEDKDEWLAIISRDERPEREPPPSPTPMLATLHRDAFDDDRWLFEPKWDGVRTLAICTNDETKLLSRRLLDITDTYPDIGGLHDRLVALEAIVDGEVVAFQEGRPSFERLQSRINLQNKRDVERATKSCPVTFIAFDLLYLDGRSTTSLPVEKRKELLDEIVVPNDRVLVSPWVRGGGTSRAETARERRLEGIVAKKLGSHYRGGRRTRDWLKIKVVHEVDVVVGGWTAGEGGRSSHFGALLVGAYDDEGLRFLGSVGTGFNDKMLEILSAQLEELATDECPFALDPTGLRGGTFGKPIRNPHWVEPSLVARVEYRELTSGYRFRAPSFKGMRTDADPRDCTLEEIVAQA